MDIKEAQERYFKKKAFFPGTFDPFTMGHMDVVEKALQDFNEVIIGIATDTPKLRRFDKDTMRIAIVQAIHDKKLENVSCIVFSGLTGKKAKELGCHSLVRGLRCPEELVYENDMKAFNQRRFDIGTTIYNTPKELKDVTSTMVRENLKEGRSIDGLVPPAVQELLL